MKKKLLTLTVALCLILMATACGNNATTETNSETNTEPTTETTNETTDEAASEAADEVQGSSETLIVGIWDTNQEPGLKEIMADFTNETGINAKIEVTPWDQYWTMLEASAEGGNMPDVFWMHANEVQKYAEGGVLADLTDVGAALDTSNYPEGLVTLYTNTEGKTIGIPKDIDTIALWYNKTLFDEAGLAYPDETWDWNTFKDAAKKLTKADGSQYGTIMKSNDGQQNYWNVIYDFGGYVINDEKTASGFDNENTIKAMEYVESLFPSMPPYETMADNDGFGMFTSGKVAMTGFGSWMVRSLLENEYVATNCDLAVMPKYNDTRKSIYNGLAWSANAATDKLDNAKKLIEYLGSKEAQLKQADLGVTLSAYKDTSAGFVGAFPEKNIGAYVEMQKDIVMMPYSKASIVWYDFCYETLAKVYAGEVPLKDGLQQMSDFMNDSLKNE